MSEPIGKVKLTLSIRAEATNDIQFDIDQEFHVYKWTVGGFEVRPIDCANRRLAFKYGYGLTPTEAALEWAKKVMKETLRG